jgi:hypothetical protein
LRSRCVALFCGHVPIVHIRDTLRTIQKNEDIPPEKIREPSDITFRIQRGDLRSFISALQFEKDFNTWDSWFERLRTAGIGKTLYVWEDGLRQAPFCILIRHVFLMMMDHDFFKRDGVSQFIDTCLEVQDAPIATILSSIPPLWEAIVWGGHKIEGKGGA